MTDFEVYKIYLALKLHFTSDYDYVKYNGKVNATLTSYQKRRDQFFFKKISRIYNKEQVVHVFVSNFVENDKMWIGDALTPECTTTYKSWLKKIESLQYTFKTDCNVLFNFVGSDNLSESFDNIFIVKNGQHPPILKLLLAKKYFIKSLKLSFFKIKSIKIFFGIILIYLIPKKLNSYFKNINNY